MSARLSRPAAVWTTWLLLLTAGAAAAQQEATPPGQPDPPDIAAWQRVGAEFGWMDVDGRLGFLGLRFRRDLPPKTADREQTPIAYRWRRWQRGVLAGLPEPGTPYGLDLSFSRVTDADLSELAGLKQLQALNLAGTKITDAGLKQLPSIALRHLDLHSTQVTDAAFKQLARFAQLEALFLHRTAVTGAGIGELARLEGYGAWH